jgi:hypothetical protein
MYALTLAHTKYKYAHICVRERAHARARQNKVINNVNNDFVSNSLDILEVITSYKSSSKLAFERSASTGLRSRLNEARTTFSKPIARHESVPVGHLLRRRFLSVKL